MKARTSIVSGIIGALLATPLAAQPVETTAESGVQAPDIDYGIGVRGRRVGVPQGVLELFVAEAASGVGSTGFGLEGIRRNGDFEIALGVEYERLEPEDGLWLEKGDTPGEPGQNPDHVEFEDFGWVTADVSFVWHKPLHEKVALRYGPSLGLGFVLGEVLRTDTTCSGSSTGSCSRVNGPDEGQYREREDGVPPVFPVIGGVFGAQIRPMDKLSVNLEVGLRTFAYAGGSVSYFF